MNPLSAFAFVVYQAFSLLRNAKTLREFCVYAAVILVLLAVVYLIVNNFATGVALPPYEVDF